MKNWIWKALVWLFWKHSIVCLLILVLIFSILAVMSIVEGYLDYKDKDDAPKQPMYWCDKHGAFPLKQTLPLFPHLQGGNVNTAVCPTCYKQAVFDNPDARLKHG